ncbi:17607_t:CDS:1, partial [Cetraspora pellucida]
LCYDIQQIIQNLEDFDINHLQVIHDQISRILENVHKPEKLLRENWIDENQRMQFLSHM